MITNDLQEKEIDNLKETIKKQAKVISRYLKLERQLCQACQKELRKLK